VYFFRDTRFRPLGGAALTFLHALEIDSGLLVHKPNGNWVPENI